MCERFGKSILRISTICMIYMVLKVSESVIIIGERYQNRDEMEETEDPLFAH